MSYTLYRNTTLGNTLQEALDELMQMKLLNDELALKVLKQFDSSVNAALSGRVKTKLNFKADKLDTYRQVIYHLSYLPFTIKHWHYFMVEMLSLIPSLCKFMSFLNVGGKSCFPTKYDTCRKYERALLP